MYASPSNLQRLYPTYGHGNPPWASGYLPTAPAPPQPSSQQYASPWMSPTGLSQPRPLPVSISSTGSERPDQKDVFRDTPVRYLGYVNELGESFKDLLKALPLTQNHAEGIVKHSYTAVGGYVAMDAFDKARKGYRASQKAGEGQGLQALNAATAGLDAALFQYGASYSIPAFLVAVTRDCLKLTLNRLLNKQETVAEILNHEIQHEIEAKGWYRFDQRLLGRLKKLIDNKGLQHLKPSTRLQQTLKKCGPMAEKNLCIALPLLGSLSIIPFIVHPIDTGVNFILDHTYRPLVQWLKQRVTSA